MKIAIASMDGTSISSHFGKSPYFLIFNIENEKIIDMRQIENTFTHHFRKEDGQHEEHGHHDEGAHHSHSGLVAGLKGCQVIIARGMGQGAYNDLTRKGFEVIVTDEKDPETAIMKFISMELTNHTERLHK